jgi:hypothetical protein
MQTQTFKIGDRIATPTGRRGEVLELPGGALLPKHALINFPSGDRVWLLMETGLLVE